MTGCPEECIPSRREIVLIRNLLLSALVLLIAWPAGSWWFAGYRDAPLSDAEVQLVLGQLDIQAAVLPHTMTAWFIEDSAGCSLEVKCAFRNPSGSPPFSASWIADSNAAEACAISGTGSWGTLAPRETDRVFREFRKSTGSVSSERSCLVRAEDDAVALYIRQSGPPNELKGRAILKRYPVREFSFIPAPDPLYVRRFP